jgi:hypothetical protein
MPKRADAKFAMDQAVKVGTHTATVVGIDNYTFTACDGRKHAWKSYTLTAEAPAPLDRFWIANVPGQGAFIFTNAGERKLLPPDAEFKPALSGLAKLKSTGDAALSSAFSALSCWQTPRNIIHSTEVFSEGPPLHFVGTPYDFKP